MNIRQFFSKDKVRMAQWLVFAVLFYGFAAYIARHPELIDWRAAGVVSQRLGHITLAAFVGYWIDRNAFKHAQNDSSGSIRRAMIISAAIIAISLGG